MTRCIVLATPVVDHQTRRITVSIVNYDRTCNAIRDYALPIADRLHHIVPLHGLCWYWLGRGEAGLQDFDAAIQDFEKAIACGFSKLGQVSESVQAERAKFWLEKVREEKRINEQTNRPSLRRLDSDLDAINFSTQDGDYAKVDYSAKQQGPGWYRENAAGAREFTKKELEEIEKIPENVQKMVLKKELSLAQSTWEICQRKQSDWLSLYERLDQMKPPKDTTDDICT
jgi:tetratricopeptide (TPR) repeat protein